MRAAVLVATLSLAACTPDVFSEAYLCGPDAICPEGQACNGPDHVCVLASKAQPFSCKPGTVTEPDDTAAQAHVLLQTDSCQAVPVIETNCMLENDAEDWVQFKVPAACTVAEQASVVLSFPFAYERLGMELWDLDQNTKVVDDGECKKSAEVGEENRCIVQTLAPGTNYGIKVHPAGDGNCGGQCSYNSYSLSLQLMTP
jgi:hypothetical protein